MAEKIGDLLDLAPAKAKEAPWSSLPDGGIIWVDRAQESELPELYALTQREVGDDITSFEVMRRVYQHNKDAFWSVYRASDNTRTDTKLIGYYALMHLTQPGLDLLEAGTFDAIDPDMRLVVESQTRPAAIYVWVIVVRRVSRIATWLLANALGAGVYGGVPIFATAGTVGGLNMLKGRGFSPQGQEAGVGKLFRLDRPPVSQSGNSSAA